MTRYHLSNNDSDLISLALTALRSGHDDGTYHQVGAAIRCENGNTYKGINCDGIHGSCAEFIAMGNAISNGEKSFDTIVAVHEKAKNNVVAPCGNCRQMLFEYCPNVLVIVNDENGNLIKVKVRDLLPFAYEEIK